MKFLTFPLFLTLLFDPLQAKFGAPRGIDGLGSAAKFDNPRGIAVDVSGNVYVADTLDSTIRKITPAGRVSTLAGTAGKDGHEDGQGTAARFDMPSGLAIDSSGNIYVADTWNNTIRKITPDGLVTTLAGVAGLGGRDYKGGLDGPGSKATFKTPSGVAVDSGGNVYVADEGDNLIRKISPEGVVNTLAGSTGNDGNIHGPFRGPDSVAVDSSGNVYVADTGNNCIRKITASGIVTTLAGLPGPGGGSVDGTGSAARFNTPSSVSVDANGNVYVFDFFTIRKITPDGVVTTLAGKAGKMDRNESTGGYDGTGKGARFSSTGGIAIDAKGMIYVADTFLTYGIIRKVTPDGVVTTLAGTTKGFTSADGKGTLAKFDEPRGVAVSAKGIVYVADFYNHTIRKISPEGDVTTLAGSPEQAGNVDGKGVMAKFNHPTALSVGPDGNIYVADTGNDAVRRVTPTGGVTTVARDITAAFGDQWYERDAPSSGPRSAVMDADGNIDVAGLCAIFQINSVGKVRVLAGSPNSGGAVDGTAVDARFNGPSGLVIDAAQNIYVAEPNNDTIRKITPAGIVTTLAGRARDSGCINGRGSAARLSYPNAVGLDSKGIIYVADTNNSVIRKIISAGEVTTLANTAGQGQKGHDIGSNKAARFDRPFSVAIDAQGNIYVADTNNNTIRKLAPNGLVSTLAGGRFE
jgi:sugar lactone lactonase YvrE